MASTPRPQDQKLSHSAWLQLGIDFFEQQIAELEAYGEVLKHTEAVKSVVLNMHEDWRQRELLKVSKKLAEMRPALAKLEAASLDRMKRALTGHNPGPSQLAEAVATIEHRGPQKHRKPRHYVGLGERRKRTEPHESGRKDRKKDKGKQRDQKQRS